MLFWRKKNKTARQEREEAEDKIVHNPNDPAIEPPVEYEAQLDPEFEKHELNETETEVIESSKRFHTRNQNQNWRPKKKIWAADGCPV